MAAASLPHFKAGAAWYGRLARQNSPEARKYPVDVAAELKAPVLGLYGGRDNGIPVADVEAMRTALTRAGKTSSSIVLYPDAQHGFHADYRASYSAPAATDAWAKMLDHFARNGVAPVKPGQPGRG
jgi:carboxymethylenebutenolidase